MSVISATALYHIAQNLTDGAQNSFDRENIGTLVISIAL